MAGVIRKTADHTTSKSSQSVKSAHGTLTQCTAYPGTLTGGYPLIRSFGSQVYCADVPRLGSEAVAKKREKVRRAYGPSLSAWCERGPAR